MSQTDVVERSDSGTSPTLDVERVGAHLAAEVHGIDASKSLDADTVAAIYHALVENKLLIFRDQVLTVEEHMRFGRSFGELSVHPFAPSSAKNPELIVLDNYGENEPNSTDVWHSDETFRHEPPMGTILRSTIAPKIGGDTILVSMTAAYEGLSDRMKSFISGLEAVHDFRPWRHYFADDPDGVRKLRELEDRFPSPTHPVVTVHPDTGEKVLYVNPQFTLYIKGMSDWESQSTLHFLFQQTHIPEYQYRVHWHENTMIFWDNRSTQHYAARDYLPQRRRMERVTIKGSRPIPAETTKGAGAGAHKPRGVTLPDGTPDKTLEDNLVNRPIHRQD